MQEVDFDEALAKILNKDSRYQREAYLFLREALGHTQKSVAKARKGEHNHVTGQELLAGIREFGLAQFGPMTQLVFNEWGIHRCEDWGEIVFNLVENNLLGKTESDTRADFQGGYDFFEAFRKPFLSGTRTTQPASPTKAS
jgi:uncharacterized repeat protein (TIGR04138 family)